MKASQCSLDDIFELASVDEEVALLLSFIQVEFGLSELRGHWNGFVEMSNDYHIDYDSKEDVTTNFTFALSEIAELPQPLFG
jgi:hypothetical protein